MASKKVQGDASKRFYPEKRLYLGSNTPRKQRKTHRKLSIF